MPPVEARVEDPGVGGTCSSNNSQTGQLVIAESNDEEQESDTSVDHHEDVRKIVRKEIRYRKLS